MIILPQSRGGRGALITAAAVLWLVLVVTSAWQKSPCVDELAHIASGWGVWTKGDLRMNPEHPMLFKVLSTALPVALMDVDPGPYLHGGMTVRSWLLSRQTEYGYYLMFMGSQRNEMDALLALVRVVPILTGLLGGAVAWGLARQFTRRFWAGPLAAALLMTYPEYAGHARFLTLDVPTLVACGALVWAALRWWRRPDARRAAMFLLVLAVGSQVKLPVTVFAGLLWFVLAALTVVGSRARLRVRHVVMLGAGMAVVWVLACWAGSGFRFTLLPAGAPKPEEISAHAPPMKGSTGLVAAVVNFCHAYHLLPEATLATLKHTTSFGGRIYILNGVANREGFYSYFFWTTMLKTPVLLLLAFCWALGMGAWLVARGMRRTWPPGSRARIVMPWRAQQAAILVLPFAALLAMMILSRNNLGHRYILFAYLPACVALAVLVTRIPAVPWGRRVVGVLLFSAVASMGFRWPHYETYFNEVIGSPYRGERYLNDSNVDWGTDFKLLGNFIREAGITEINIALFGFSDHAAYGIPNDRFIIPYYPHAILMKPPKPLEPTLPTAISMANLANVRVMYPDYHWDEPAAYLNSIVVYLPKSSPAN